MQQKNAGEDIVEQWSETQRAEFVYQLQPAVCILLCLSEFMTFEAGPATDVARQDRPSRRASAAYQLHH